MSRLLLGPFAAALAALAVGSPAHAQDGSVSAPAPVTPASAPEAGMPIAGSQDPARSHHADCCDDGTDPDGAGSDMGRADDPEGEREATGACCGDGACKHHVAHPTSGPAAAPEGCPECRGNGPGECGREVDGCPRRDARDHLPPFLRSMLGARNAGVRLDPHVLVQVQGALMTADDNLLERGDRAERRGFALRRARLGFTGTLGKRVSAGVEADLSRGADLLNEAWLGIRAWRSGQIVVGSHKLPFSRHALLGSGDQALADRPLAVQALAPFRQVGATVHGSYQLGGLAWWLSAANGFDRQSNFYAGVRENEGLKGNRTGGLAMAARVQAEPLGRLGRSVADHERGPLRFEVGSGALMSQGGATDSLSMSADLQVKMRGFHLLAEVLWDRTVPQTQPAATGGLPDTVRREALTVEAGYAWWRLHGAARVEMIDADTGIEDNRDEMVVSAAIGYQLPANQLRVLLQFDTRIERFVPQVANDTLFAQAQLQL